MSETTLSGTTLVSITLAAEWRSGFVFTTEFGEPCDCRNAFRALRAAAMKAGLPHAAGSQQGDRRSP